MSGNANFYPSEVTTVLAIGHAIRAARIAFGVQGHSRCGPPGAHRFSVHTDLFELGNPLGIQVLADLCPGTWTGGHPAVDRDADGTEGEDILFIGNTLAEVGATGVSVRIDPVALGCPRSTGQQQTGRKTDSGSTKGWDGHGVQMKRVWIG